MAPPVRTGLTDPRILDAPPGRGLTPARLLRAFVPGAAGLLFGSRALASWAGRLPDNWDVLRHVLVSWDQGMQAVGLTVPYDLVQGWARVMVDATF